MSFTTNNVINVAETCLKGALTSLISAVAPTVPIYTSDLQSDKSNQPYVIIHVKEATEQIGPGTGIFEVPVEIKLRSHVKQDSTSTRDAIQTAINNFVYSNPANTLSTYATSNTLPFYCYGFMEIEVSMGINTETKSYEYVSNFRLVCMPRPNV